MGAGQGTVLLEQQHKVKRRSSGKAAYRGIFIDLTKQ